MWQKIKCFFDFHEIRKVDANVPWMHVREWRVCRCCSYKALFQLNLGHGWHQIGGDSDMLKHTRNLEG